MAYITEEHMNDVTAFSKFGFIDTLNRYLKHDSIVVTDAGATTEIPMQGLKFTNVSQRYLGSASQCEMGYAIPGRSVLLRVEIIMKLMHSW